MSDLSIDDVRVPDVIGEVTGWRAWKIVRHPRLGPRLQSCAFTTVWPTNDWCLAECRKNVVHPEGCPGRTCECGLYAARDKKHLLSMHYPKYDENVHEVEQPIVIGQVGFAGRIMTASLGYRAEKGRILKIEVPYVFMKELGEPLAKLYRGIEVVAANTLELNSDAARHAAEAVRRRMQQRGGGQ